MNSLRLEPEGGGGVSERLLRKWRDRHRLNIRTDDNERPTGWASKAKDLTWRRCACWALVAVSQCRAESRQGSCRRLWLWR